MQVTIAKKIPMKRIYKEMLHKSAYIASKNSSPLLLYLSVICNLFLFSWIVEYQNKVQQNITMSLTSGVWHSTFSHIAQMIDI
jgi:uncharacterized membrane protein YesL